MLEPIFATKDTNEWLDALLAVDVPCGPVWSLPELFGQAQRPPGVDMLELVTSSGETYETVGPAARLNSGCRQTRAAPLVGEHPEQVLRALLGLDRNRLEQLHADGVIQ